MSKHKLLMWTSQLLFVHLSYVLLWQSVAPNRFQCSSNLSSNLSPSGRVYYVLRTFHWIYLPSVEGMMFCRTDYRFWPALLCIAPASAYGICVKTLPLAVMYKGLFQEWSFCENNSVKNDSVEKLFWWSLLQIDEIKWMFVRIDACISEQPNSHFISDVAYDSITKIYPCIDENCLQNITLDF